MEERSVQSKGELGRLFGINRKTGDKSAEGRRGNAQHCYSRGSILSTALLPTGGQHHKNQGDFHYK